MPVCPKCGCTDCKPNKFENVSFDQVAGGALAARQSGRHALGLSAMLAWAGVEAANYFRDDFKCLYCGATF